MRERGFTIVAVRSILIGAVVRILDPIVFWSPACGFHLLEYICSFFA